MEDNLYELVFDPDNVLGVTGISLVEHPAIEVVAMKFSKEEIALQFSEQVKEDKQILVSPILIPNKKIYRKDIGGEEGFVYVTEETIEKLQENFFEKSFHKNSSFEHRDKITEGVVVIESWIIEDPLNDKSNALGFENLPKGTWMVSIKITDKEIWNNFIKTGKVQGLSIDAFLSPVKQESIQFNKQFNMKKNLTSLFKKAVAKRVAMNADLMEVKINDELSYFVSGLEVGSSVLDVEGNAIQNTQFDFEGKTYFVGEEGTITEIIDIEASVEVEFTDEEIEAILEEVKEEIVVDYEAQVAELNAKIAELEAKLAIYETAEEANVELKKQTPAKPIATKFNKDIKPEPAKGILGVMRNLK